MRKKKGYLDLWRQKMQTTLKKSPKNSGFISAEACEAGRRDWTVFGVVDETTTTKFASRACAVHCISLPVVVDKVVVVVLKFPNVEYAHMWEVCMQDLHVRDICPYALCTSLGCHYVQYRCADCTRVELDIRFVCGKQIKTVTRITMANKEVTRSPFQQRSALFMQELCWLSLQPELPNTYVGSMYDLPLNDWGSEVSIQVWRLWPPSVWLFRVCRVTVNGCWNL